jgi:hypothetical protein
LIFNFRQVITLVSVKSGNGDRDRDEVINYFLDDISNTISFGVVVDWWIENDSSISQVNSNIENWKQLVVLVVGDTDLISEVLHGGTNTFSDSLDYQTVHIVNIRDPSWGFLVWLDVLKGIFKKFMDFFTMVFDIFKS